MMKYKDPYGARNYALIDGCKKDSYFRLEFKEGRFYSIDEGLILIADVTTYKGGIQRVFKPEEELKPGFCAVSIYDREFNLWSKKDGKNVPTKTQPSLYERNLCGYLKLEYSTEKTYSGNIGFMPDDQLTSLSEDEIINVLKTGCKLEEIEPSGNLPQYQANSSSKKSYGKVTFAEKATWLKKELCEAVASSNVSEDSKLANLTRQLVIENEENETFLALYTDFLKAILNS